MIQSTGRSRLLELGRELATAREGRALLDRKREAVLRALTDRLPQLDAARKTLVEKLHRAHARLIDAQNELGRRAIDAAALAQVDSVDVEASELHLVGVPLPQLRAVGNEFQPRYGPVGVSPVLDGVGDAYRRLLPDVLTLAELEVAVRRLRRTLDRTVRRLNALDLLIVPELSGELRVVSSSIEEEERDEAVRRRRWSGRNDGGQVTM